MVHVRIASSSGFLGLGLDKLQAQNVPGDVGSQVFASNASRGFPLDHGTQLRRNLPFCAQELADELGAAIDRCGERGTAALEVYRALNGFVHEAGR